MFFVKSLPDENRALKMETLTQSESYQLRQHCSTFSHQISAFGCKWWQEQCFVCWAPLSRRGGRRSPCTLIPVSSYVKWSHGPSAHLVVPLLILLLIDRCVNNHNCLWDTPNTKQMTNMQCAVRPTQGALIQASERGTKAQQARSSMVVWVCFRLNKSVVCRK